MEESQDPGKFCIVEASCDFCSGPGPYYHLTQDVGDGGDWMRVKVYCEICLRDMQAAIHDVLARIAFSRGDKSA